MKITAVGQNNYNRAFKGLWGETIPKKGYSENSWHSDIYDYETKEYHPFADENIEALSNVQKKNSTYKTCENPEKKNCFIHTGTNICIKAKLLFTAKQWQNYISHKMAASCPEFKFIEKNLKSLHLERYLRR